MAVRRVWLVLLLVGLILGMAACSKDEDDLAPDSIAGQTYRLNLTGGTGAYPAGVTLTMVFTETNYTLTDPLGNVRDMGTYAYTKTGDDAGEVVFTSTVVAGNVSTGLFTFTNEGAGNFTLTSPIGTAEGTFSQQAS